MTRKFIQRGLFAIAFLGVMMVAGQSVASAASPGTGVPVVGGLLDSIVGIVTGTIYGIGGAIKSVLASLGLVL